MSSNSFTRRAAALSALALFAALSARAMPTGYTVVDLGPSREVTAIGRFDRLAAVPAIVGEAGAEKYVHGQWRQLHSRGDSYAWGVNAQGDIAGSDDGLPVIWSHGHRQVLKSAGAGEARGIADDGTVAGSNGSCFTWRDGKTTDIGNLGSGCVIGGIDSTARFVTGYSFPGRLPHAFLHDATGMHDLGTGGGPYSYGVAVNKYGHVAVTSSAFEDYTASYWNGSTLIPVVGVNADSSYALGINDRDEVFLLGRDPEGHIIFVYEGATGNLTPVEPLIHNPAGWFFGGGGFAKVGGIANDGTLVGNGTYMNEEHGYMLVPD